MYSDSNQKMGTPWFDELEWVIASKLGPHSQSYLALGSLAVIFIHEDYLDHPEQLAHVNEMDHETAIKTALEFEEGAEILKEMGYDDNESQTAVLTHFQKEYPAAFHIAFKEIQGYQLSICVDKDRIGRLSFNPEAIICQCDQGYTLNQIAKVIVKSIDQLYDLNEFKLDDHQLKFHLKKENKILHVLIYID
jgi:hypothetical protein